MNFSLRAQFADPEDVINPIHGADSVTNAAKEIGILFPQETTVAVIKPEVNSNEEERGKLQNSYSIL